MERYHVRKVKMDDHVNREDRMWVFFAEGKIDRPLVVLSDIQLRELLAEIEEQQ